MDLLKEIWERKQRLLQLLQRAKEYGWIDDSTLKAEIKRAEEQKLTIGVIGQMKAGKSTFLNSFIFGDTILPAATSPMTASLSYITYGPEKKLVAEFYTPDEWVELRNTAQLSIEEGQESTAQGSKIKAAQELVAKAGKISQLDSLLGKTKEDSFSNLIDYVGADGKYIAITKAVTLYYPLEYLKGVEIVDTPGFNDPIVSREERTRQFLKQADVSLLLLYAGLPLTQVTAISYSRMSVTAVSVRSSSVSISTISMWHRVRPRKKSPQLRSKHCDKQPASSGMTLL